MNVKMMKHYVQNTDTGAKARVHYSKGQVCAKGSAARDCVRIYGKTILEKLTPIFESMVKNNTDTMTDYFETDSVTLFPGDVGYNKALALAQPDNPPPAVSGEKENSMTKKTVSTATEAGQAAGTKPRKEKTPARWAVLTQVSDGGEGFVYRIVIDKMPTERLAKQEAEFQKITGKILIVCIHGEAEAVPVSEVKFNWAK
jgi:hypothetical protein